MKKLLLGLLSLVLYFSSAIGVAGECLTDNGDGTLTDPNTGLIWQTCALGQVWNGTGCSGEESRFPWVEALWAAKGNNFQNRPDWILPTKSQYESLLQSNCNRWKTGSFWSSSESEANYAWFVYFDFGSVNNYYRLDSFAVRLVRASQLSDLETFNASYATTLELRKALEAYEVSNKKALSAYEVSNNKNTIPSYLEFLNKYPSSPYSSRVRDNLKPLVEASILKAEATFSCEEARNIDKQTESAGISPMSSFDSCVDKRKFNNVLNLKNPQQQYFEAVKYENNKERSRAKRIYLTIMDKSPTSPIAMKAADRIAALSDVEAVESASDASRAAAERAAEASRRAGEASREAATSVNRQNYDQCRKNRDACWSGCDVYKNSSQRDSCKSGCASCAN